MAYTTTSKDTKDLSITIYNNGSSVVKEKRNVDIPCEEEYIQYMDVAQRIETDSIIINGLEIIELNYDYDLVSREKLLQKYIDKIVCLYDSKENSNKECRLLSVTDGIVLEKVDTKEILINPEGQIILPKLPTELITKPALIWKIGNVKSNEIGVSYITSGIKWIADYVINLKNKTLDITGWVNIENNSGTTYENANLKLMAGDVRRVEKRNNSYYPRDIVLEERPTFIKNQFVEKSFEDYHMYILQRKTTLKNNQSKEINFINLNGVPYRKYYVNTGNDEKLNIIIEFENNKASGMGIPLPMGKVKVYKGDDDDNNLEFVGEDRIDHTPKDEKIKLYIGKAFDIRYEGALIDSRKDSEGNIIETYEYKIVNHKDEEIDVKLHWYTMENDWKILWSTDKYEAVNFNNIRFDIRVNADFERRIRFQYRLNRKIAFNVRRS